MRQFLCCTRQGDLGVFMTFVDFKYFIRLDRSVVNNVPECKYILKVKQKDCGDTQRQVKIIHRIVNLLGAVFGV